MANKNAQELADSFGYLHEGEVDALRKLAADLTAEYPVIVNVGAGAGTSGLALYEGNPEAVRFTVDISMGGPLGGLSNEVNAFKDAGYPLPNQIPAPSHVAAEMWGWWKIDLIFIDDGHEEFHIRGDIEKWRPHMKDGGVMAFHDYGSNNWPAVKQVVDELMEDDEMILHVNTIIAFRIRKDE